MGTFDLQSRNRKIDPQPAGEQSSVNHPAEGNLNVLGKYVLKVVSALVSAHARETQLPGPMFSALTFI